MQQPPHPTHQRRASALGARTGLGAVYLCVKWVWGATSLSKTARKALARGVELSMMLGHGPGDACLFPPPFLDSSAKQTKTWQQHYSHPYAHRAHTPLSQRHAPHTHRQTPLGASKRDPVSFQQRPATASSHPPPHTPSKMAEDPASIKAWNARLVAHVKILDHEATRRGMFVWAGRRL